MNVAKSLENIDVLNPDGKPVRLGDYWKEKPVVLAFIRHFGCIFCREQVAQLRDKVSEIRAAGADLVIVGNGRPEHATDFRDAYKVESPLVVDPELKAYRAAGLKRSMFSTFGPRVLAHGVRALISGQRQGAIRGDPWQQGGVFIIRPDKTVVYSYVSKEAGDHPEPADVLAALDKAVGRKRVRNGKRS